MSKLKLPPVPLLVLLTVLTGCGTADFKVDCPQFPIAGKEVGNQIKEVCDKRDCDKLGEWISRLGVLKDQLDECAK